MKKQTLAPAKYYNEYINGDSTKPIIPKGSTVSITITRAGGTTEIIDMPVSPDMLVKDTIHYKGHYISLALTHKKASKIYGLFKRISFN